MKFSVHWEWKVNLRKHQITNLIHRILQVRHLHHFVRAFSTTYGIKYLISNCSNNYGPNQYPEKLIPVIIKSVLKRNKIPIYGDGNYTRDWLYVKDHARAIDLIFHKGSIGKTYNIGGHADISNLELVKIIGSEIEEQLKLKKNTTLDLIEFVDDRPGHDKRYAIDCHKIKSELGWSPSYSLAEGIKKTVFWYINNKQGLAEK